MEVKNLENYKVLGVDENASMEEIEKAYKNKVKEFQLEIKDEKRAKIFIKAFDKAYEEIKAEREKIHNQQTMIMNINEMDFNEDYDTEVISRYDEKYDEFKYSDEDENKSIIRKAKKKYSTKNNVIAKRRKSYENKKSKKVIKDKYEEREAEVNIKKKVVKQKEKSSIIATIINLILKILSVPVIILLSIIIFLCNILSLISWVASKVIIVAAISLSAIHGYQIYIGHAIRYEIFILSGLGFIVSLFLPSILKIVPSILEKINSRLKNFVF